MGRFTTFVFVMGVALGLVPATALAQQPRVVRENGQDVLLVPVRGRMDLGAVVRLGNQYAAPGNTITADVVVEANPGKINFACYRGPGNHYGSRNPANWQTCSASQQRRWVVTGLEYRVPLQPRAVEQRQNVPSPVLVVSTRPSANAEASPSASTGADRDALALRFARNEGAIEDMPDAYRASLHDHREYAARMDKIETEQRYLWVALIIACSLAIGLLVKSLRSSRQETAQSFAPAFAGASVSGSTATSRRIERTLAAPVLRQASPSIVPSPREFAAGVRSQPPPVSQEHVAQAKSLVLNLAAEQRSTQAFLAGKERLPRLLHLTDKLFWKLHDTAYCLRTLEALPVEAPARRDDPDRFAEQLAKLTLRQRLAAPRFTMAQRAFDRLHYAHTGLRLPRLWEAPDEQLLQQRAEAKLLHCELDKAQAKLNDLEHALLSANGAAAAAKDDAESQRKLRDEEAARFAEQLKELRSESHRERDAYVDDLDAKVKLINRLQEQLEESERSNRDQDRQIDDLSGHFTHLTSRVVDLETELSKVTEERDRLQGEKVNLIAMLDEQANGHGQNPNGVNTRKITQPFAPIQRPAAQANPSGSPPSPPPKRRRRKTDPPPSG